MPRDCPINDLHSWHHVHTMLKPNLSSVFEFCEKGGANSGISELIQACWQAYYNQITHLERGTMATKTETCTLEILIYVSIEISVSCENRRNLICFLERNLKFLKLLMHEL